MIDAEWVPSLLSNNTQKNPGTNISTDISYSGRTSLRALCFRIVKTLCWLCLILHLQTKLFDGATVYVKKVGIISYSSKQLFVLRVKDVVYCGKGWFLGGSVLFVTIMPKMILFHDNRDLNCSNWLIASLCISSCIIQSHFCFISSYLGIHLWPFKNEITTNLYGMLLRRQSIFELAQNPTPALPHAAFKV